jgi:hypothetical protein
MQNLSPTAASLPISPPEHEAFALAVASGTPAATAYREHCANGGTAKTSWENASKLLYSTKVAPRVEFLRAEAAKVGLKNFGVTADTVLRQHLEIVTTPLSEVDENHPLCAKLKRTRRLVPVGETKEPWMVEEVSLPCKSRALEAIAQICGFHSPTKSETTVNYEPTSDDLLESPGAMHSFGLALRGNPEAIRALLNGLDGRPLEDTSGGAYSDLRAVFGGSRRVPSGAVI